MLTEDESERTRIGGRIAKQFAKVVNPSSPTPSVCLRMRYNGSRTEARNLVCLSPRRPPTAT